MSTTRFRAYLGEWHHLTSGALIGLARQSCQSVSERVIDNTTVDTGFLRGSWQPSLNEIDETEGEEDPTGAKVIAKLAAVIVDMELGDVFMMTNNAEYALRYEHGFVGEDSLGRTYDQAGRKVVTDAITAFPIIIAIEAAKLGFKVQ